MSKILTMILFQILGKFVSEKFLKELVIKLISLSLKELKDKRFFKDDKREERLDEIIQMIQDNLLE